MINLLITWVQTPMGDGWEVEPDVVVWVSVSKIEASFAAGDQWIGPGGSGRGQETRYASIGQHFLSGYPMYMPYISLDDADRIRFTDGRQVRLGARSWRGRAARRDGSGSGQALADAVRIGRPGLSGSGPLTEFKTMWAQGPVGQSRYRGSAPPPRPGHTAKRRQRRRFGGPLRVGVARPSAGWTAKPPAP
jgi:hypothetical protein